MRKADYLAKGYLGNGTENIAAAFSAAAKVTAAAIAAQRTGRCLTEAGYKLYAVLTYRRKHARKSVARQTAAGSKYGNGLADMTAKAVNYITCIHGISSFLKSVGFISR